MRSLFAFGYVGDAAGAGKGGGVQSAAMSNRYKQITTAIHVHWKAHGNACPRSPSG